MFWNSSLEKRMATIIFSPVNRILDDCTKKSPLISLIFFILTLRPVSCTKIFTKFVKNRKYFASRGNHFKRSAVQNRNELRGKCDRFLRFRQTPRAFHSNRFLDGVVESGGSDQRESEKRGGKSGENKIENRSAEKERRPLKFLGDRYLYKYLLVQVAIN